MENSNVKAVKFKELSCKFHEFDQCNYCYLPLFKKTENYNFYSLSLFHKLFSSSLFPCNPTSQPFYFKKCKVY